MTRNFDIVRFRRQAKRKSVSALRRASISHHAGLEALEGRVLLSVTFNEFPTPDGTTILNIANGPDGNLWFTDSFSNEVEQMSPGGSLMAVYGSSAGVTGFPAGSDPEGITAGGDGNIWFTQRAASQVSVLTTAANATAANPVGTITSIPTQGHPYEITQGPNEPGNDATVWFTESSPSGAWIGEIDVKTHALQEFPLSNANSDPVDIYDGIDGSLYFTERASNAIGRIDLVSHQITEYPIPTAASQPTGITLGIDGNLWFTESAGNKIGSFVDIATTTTSSTTVPSNGAVFLPGASTPSFGPGATIPAGTQMPVGTMIEYSGLTSGSQPYGITFGPDGNLWFSESATQKLAEITTSGAVTEFSDQTPGPPYGITSGPDGNVWFAEEGAVGRANLPGSELSITTMNVPNSPVVVSSGSGVVPDNQLIDYQIPVFSNGPDPAQGVVLTVTLPDGVTFHPTGSGNDGTLLGNTVTFNVGDLAPHTAIFEDVFATAAQPGTYTATANVTCTSPQKNLPVASASASVTVVQGADMAVTSMKVSNTAPKVGDDFSYTLTVINNGPDIAKGAVLTDVLPAGLQFLVNGSTGVYDDTTGTFTENLGDLDPGVPVNVTINVQATKTGTYTNTATASCNWPDNNPSNDSQTVDVSVAAQGSDLAIQSVQVPQDPVADHTEFTYTVTVINNGPDVAVGTTLIGFLAPHMSIDPARSSSSYDAASGTFKLGDLNPNVPVVVTIAVLPTQPGAFTISPTVSCTSPENDPANDTMSASVQIVPSADLQISGKVVTDGAAGSNNGGHISYLFTITNRGPDTASQVAFVDQFPLNAMFIKDGDNADAFVAVNSNGTAQNPNFISVQDPRYPNDPTKTIIGAITDVVGDIGSGNSVTVSMTVTTLDDQEVDMAPSVGILPANGVDPNLTNNTVSPALRANIADPTSGALNVTVTGTGAGAAPALSAAGITPDASSEPLVGADGIVTIIVSSQVPFANPTVILTFDDGMNVKLDNSGEPSVAVFNAAANDYEYTYIEPVAQQDPTWPAGGTGAPDNVYISVSGVDLEGNPLSENLVTGPSFGIVSTTTITASTPTLTFSSKTLPDWHPTRQKDDSFEPSIDVPSGSDFQFQVLSAIPNADSNSSLRLFAAGVLPAPLTLTDHFGDPNTQDQTTLTPNPAFLNGDFQPTSADIGQTFYLIFDALNLNTQESTGGILKLHVVNANGTAPETGAPSFTASTNPLGFAPPDSSSVVSIDIHIHSDTSLLTTPVIQVFAPGSQTPVPFSGAIYVNTLLDGSLDYFDYDAIETFAATDPVGVYRFRVTAQDKTNPQARGACNVYVYDGTPGDLTNLTSQLLQQPQNQPAPPPSQLAETLTQIDGGFHPAGPVPGALFVDGTPDNPVVSTIVPTATGFALLDQAGQVIAQGGGNVVSHDGATFTLGGPASNVTFLNAQGLIAQGGGNVIAQGGGNIIAAGGGNVIAQGGGNIIVVANSLVANASTFSPVEITLPGLAAPLVSTNGGNFTYNGVAVPLLGDNGAALIGQDGAGLIGQDGAGLIGQDGAGLVSGLSDLTGFANTQSLIQLASSASLASSLATSSPAIATATVVPGPVPLGAGIAPSASPAGSPSGVASTPLGAAQDAMLYADIMVRDEAELLQNGQPASVAKPRGDDAIAALDAATVALNQGFAALTPDQLAALQRAGSIIMLNVTPATPGGTVAPGSPVILTPVNAADALATSTASVPAGQGGALTLGGSVVTVGGTLPSPLQLGARLNIVPLDGQSASLLSAAPGQVVAQLPTYLPTNGPQLIFLTTADGRLAIGAVNVHQSTGSIQFSAPTYTWGKNGATANIIVTRTGGSSGATAAIVSTSDGTATAGVDYTATSDMVFFGDGDTHPRLISIPLLAGDSSTGDKTINLTLSSPLNGASIGTQATSTLNLQDGLGTIQGQVFEDQNGDGVKQSGDPGLVNAVVYIDVNGDGVLNNSVSGNNVGDLNATEPFTITDSQGNYTLGGLAPGSYTVRVVVPNGRTETTAATQSVTIDGSGAVVSGENFGLSPALTAGTAGVPALASQSDTGVSGTDGITQDNGSTTAPLTFNLSETGATTDFLRLYDVTNPANPVMLGTPVQATGGTATLTLSGTPLADGTHQLAVTAAVTATSTESALSSALTITIDTTAPSSSVNALPATSGINIPVSWGGSDNTGGSGLASYNVLVSDNGGSFTTWLSNTTQTSATYQGAYGHTYAFDSVASDVAGNSQAVPSTPQATTQTVATPLEVTGVSPAAINSAHYLTSLPGNQIIITFNRAIAGLTADKADGTGFRSAPFAVMLIPSGPDGAALAAQNKALWTAPSGVDNGDLPLPAKAVYHVNPVDGTSTITLTPNQPLSSDVYLLTVNPMHDLYGDPLGGPAISPFGTIFMSFDYQPDATNTSPLRVTGVTTQHGTVAINNNAIAQPDTIGIQFNKPVNSWTVNSSNIQLLANPAPGVYQPVNASVFYSPSTQTAYITPSDTLMPTVAGNPSSKITYIIAVGAAVSDDQKFPASGNTLGQTFYTSFTLTNTGSGPSMNRPLTVVGTTPNNGTVWPGPLGYAAIQFSEPIDLQSLSRFSAMFITQTGGLNTGTSGYADVPVNAKLAFNVNTNQLIIVPTGVLPNHIVDLIALQGIKAQNNTDVLQNAPFFATFLLNNPLAAPSLSQASVAAAEFVALAVPAGTAPTGSVPSTPSVPQSVSIPRVIHLARPAQAVVSSESGHGRTHHTSRWPLGPKRFTR